MKLFVCAWAFLLLALPSSAQDIGPATKKFVKYIFAHYRVPDTLKNDCYWNFAVVSVQTNSLGKVVSVSLVNDDSTALFAPGLAFLNGYEFPNNSLFKNKAVIFTLSIDQRKTKGCDMVGRDMTPTVALARHAIHLETARKKDPQAIFLYAPLIFAVNGGTP